MSDQIEIEEYGYEIRLLAEEEQRQMEALDAKRRKAAIPLYEVAPTSADVVPVVRCKDCKYRNGDYCHNYDGFAHFDHFFVQMDDYCSRGERMDGEQDE